MRHDQLDPLFNAPPVLLLEFVLQTPQFLEEGRRTPLGELDCRAVIARDQLAQVAQPVGDDVEDRAIGREGQVLLESGNAQTRLCPYGPGVWWLLAAQDPQQGRLPDSVSADNRDAFTSLDP